MQEAIRVMLRVRPPSTSIIHRKSDNRSTLQCMDKQYHFDYVIEDQTETQIFEKVGLDLIDHTINGFNSCLFMYGQTGTGKTYTMTGNSQHEGIVQRSLKHLFLRLANKEEIINFSMKLGYFQIYNETIKDLFTQKILSVRQMAKTGFYIQGLQEIPVNNQEDIAKLVKLGLTNRSVKATKMNEESSRSHSILTVVVEVKYSTNNGFVIKSSKINFVDLAGSQKQKQTTTAGDRLKQASKINQSLSVLSNVISKLSEKSKRSNHIPYRDSVLTKILKDSIGGNSHTIMIGAISADQAYICQTISTLQFLERVKKIKNQASVNQKVQGNEEFVQTRFQELENKINELKESLKIKEEQLKDISEQKNRLWIQNQELKRKIIQIQRPSWTLIDRLNQSDLNENQCFEPFQNEFNQPYVQQLHIIQENYSSQVKSTKRSKIFKPSVIQQQQDNLQGNHDQLQFVNLSKLQNQFFTNEIVRYKQQQMRYSSLLRSLEQNLEQLNFKQAQLDIIAVQKVQLEDAKENLKICAEERNKLLQMLEEQRVKIRSQIKLIRKKEIEKVVQFSSQRYTQNIIQSEKSALQSKIAELQNKFAQKDNQMYEETLLMNEKISNLQITLSETEKKLYTKTHELNELRQLMDIQKAQADKQRELYMMKYRSSDNAKDLFESQKLQRLEDQINHNKLVISQYEMKIIDMEYIVEQMNCNIAEMSDKLYSQSIELTSKRQELMNYEEEVVYLQNQVNVKNEQICKIQEDLYTLEHKSKMQLNIDGSKVSLYDLLADYSNVKKKSQSQRVSLEDKEKQLGKQKENNVKLLGLCISMEQFYTSQIKTKNRQINHLKRSKNDHQVQLIQTKKNDRHVFQEDENTLEHTKLKQEHKRIVQLHHKYEEQAQSYKNYTSKIIRNLELESEELKKELSTIKSQKQQLYLIITRLSGNSNAHQNFRQSRMEEDRRKNYELLVEHYKKELEEKNRENQNLVKFNENKKIQLREMKELIFSLKLHISKIEYENKELKTNKFSLQSKIKAFPLKPYK